MIRQLISSVFRARQSALHVMALLGLASLTMLTAAQAKVPDLTPSSVITSDQFGIEVLGYNVADPSGAINLITNNLAPFFGFTQIYPNGALAGQTLTVVSAEGTDGGITTDTIIIAVPTNFIPTGLNDSKGNLINGIEFSIGTYNGGTSPLDFNTALIAPITTGAVTFKYGSITTAIGVIPTVSLTNGNKSYSGKEDFISDSTTPVSAYQVTSLSFTISYPAAVPEPSTVATVLLGVAGLLWVTTRRRKRA